MLLCVSQGMKHAMATRKLLFEVMITLTKTTGDIAESIQEPHCLIERQQTAIHKSFAKHQISCSSRYCFERGWECGDSNFMQLLQLWGQDDLRISGWMAKKTNKYTSPD